MSSRHSGLFITVEGIDGAGKSTHLPILEAMLAEEGYTVLRTREPGGTESSNRLRDMLLQYPLTPESELLLMFAARQEHLHHVIRPALSAGQCVLCDRFTDSSYAYQGAGRGIEDGMIQNLETWIQQGLNPDLTLYFDLSVEVSLQRRAARALNTPLDSTGTDRFEDESSYFFDRVRQGYLDRVRKHPHRFYVIDAAESIEKIQSRLKDFMHDWLRYYNLTERHPLHA